ncbi:MAG TPA: 2-dehydropantoate 2-reductase [Candidatus Binatia bacterium]|jgi:2-dehydropantoate 2-reductase
MAPAQKMRIAVMGAGAVGGYFGARLAAAGQNVAFIARGSHLDAMRKEGLKVKSIQGDLHIRALFTSDPSEIGSVDLVLFCVKSFDTEDAAVKLAPMIGEKTVVLSLQNGIDNPDKIAARWGKARVLAAVVYLGAAVAAPGKLEHRAGGRIVLGDLDGQTSETAKRVEQVLSGAEIPCALSSEIRKVMWTKLVWNAPFCAISCLARANVREILESDSLKKLAADCMEEVREAARSAGIELAPSVIEETFAFSKTLGNFKPSMLQDLEARKPLEYEALNGIVVRLLREKGKKAPINEAAYAVLKFLDQRIRAGLAHRS